MKKANSMVFSLLFTILLQSCGNLESESVSLSHKTHERSHEVRLSGKKFVSAFEGEVNNEWMMQDSVFTFMDTKRVGFNFGGDIMYTGEYTIHGNKVVIQDKSFGSEIELIISEDATVLTQGQEEYHLDGSIREFN